MKLNKLRWLSALGAFALCSGFVMHLAMSSDEVPLGSDFEIANATEEEKQKLLPPPVTPEQVTALTIKLAELQSQVLRLNALGDRLAEEASIPASEFNFEQLPPSGGPVVATTTRPEVDVNELLTSITDLENTLVYEEKQLKLLESLTLGHHIENTRYLSGRPITKGWLSSYYGMRKDPFSGKPAMHKGVDFAGKEDADIIATASGVVTWSGERYGYGQLIEINHGDGIKTRYGHNKVLKVEVGDVVSKGQVIAKMGSTGRSTGPHVHYEILRNNTQINPIKYVYRKAKK